MLLFDNKPDPEPQFEKVGSYYIKLSKRVYEIETLISPERVIYFIDQYLESMIG